MDRDTGGREEERKRRRQSQRQKDKDGKQRPGCAYLGTL